MTTHPATFLSIFVSSIKFLFIFIAYLASLAFSQLFFVILTQTPVILSLQIVDITSKFSNLQELIFNSDTLIHNCGIFDGILLHLSIHCQSETPSKTQKRQSSSSGHARQNHGLRKSIPVSLISVLENQNPNRYPRRPFSQ